MLRYVITDRHLLAKDKATNQKTPVSQDPLALQTALVLKAAAWARDGVDYIQVREKDLPLPELEQLVAKLVAAVRKVGGPGKALHWTRVLVNGSAEAAIATRADGVHLTAAQGSRMTLQVREMFVGAGLPEPAISVSCHTLREAEAARDAGVNLALYGPVFGKVVKGVALPGVGLDALRVVSRAAAPMPVLALGGVAKDTADECENAGAAGIAGVRMFL